ncbi:MAG: M28 family peptidase [Muribaculaceae bacterium]|nr:M28 family peptidase [Muribaculaceae bacterium]
MRHEIAAFALAVLLGVMSSGACTSVNAGAQSDSAEMNQDASRAAVFNGDSAYRYVAKQVEFGPRVPNTPAHKLAGDWLASELRRHGAQEVIEQPLTLRAFDGTQLQARNILARYNPDASERILLLAHWDCRPWADEDKDEAKRSLPVDGANDGASGVGVLLEVARQLGLKSPSKGIDILFVDAEDWGSEGDEDSWALGAQAFAANPPVKGYSAKEAILLDMVGGENATFRREYFSEKAASDLNASLWNIASRLGYSSTFPNQPGSAITDDHVRLIETGIPTIDIIEYNPANGGFNPRWHTSADTMEGISSITLQAVGDVVMTYLRNNY